MFSPSFNHWVCLMLNIQFFTEKWIMLSTFTAKLSASYPDILSKVISTSWPLLTLWGIFAYFKKLAKFHCDTKRLYLFNIKIKDLRFILLFMFYSVCWKRKHTWLVKTKRLKGHVLPGNFGVAVTAGHVKWRPAIFVSLVNISAIFNQQLHNLQVSCEHGFM